MADTVMGCIGCWGEGGFSGEKAAENTAKFATADCVLDADAVMKNTTGYKTYNGHAGWTEWIDFLTQIDFAEFTPTVVGSKDDKVYVTATYTPKHKTTGKSAPKQYDMHEWTVKDGKISQIKFYWGKCDQLDSIFAA